MELMKAMDQFEIWPPLIGIILLLLDKQMKPIVRKSIPKLVVQLRFRAVGEMQAKWQTFEKLENKTQMYGLGGLATMHLSLISRFFKCLPFHLCLAYSSETWLYY